MSSYRSVVWEYTYLSTYVVFEVWVVSTIAVYINMMFTSFQQLWTVVVWVTQPMAKLVTLLEQHLERQPPTVVQHTTNWWEVVFAHVKLQESGLGMHLPVNIKGLLLNIRSWDIVLSSYNRKYCSMLNQEHVPCSISSMFISCSFVIYTSLLFSNARTSVAQW